jgi:inosose dehydratase
MITNRRKFFKAAGVSALALGGLPSSKSVASVAKSHLAATSDFDIGIATYSLRTLNLEQMIEAMNSFDLKKICLKSMHLLLESGDDEIRNVITRIKDAGLDTQRWIDTINCRYSVKYYKNLKEPDYRLRIT